MIVTCEPMSGSTLEIGETEVVCTAVDENWNEATCVFYVHIAGEAFLCEIKFEKSYISTVQCK